MMNDGEEGFLKLTYVGNAPNTRRWLGAETGTWYYFGPGDTLYVDSRDGERFLYPLKGNGRAFIDDTNEGD